MAFFDVHDLTGPTFRSVAVAAPARHAAASLLAPSPPFPSSKVAAATGGQARGAESARGDCRLSGLSGARLRLPPQYYVFEERSTFRLALPTPYCGDALAHAATALVVAERGQAGFFVDFVACARKQRLKGIVSDAGSGAAAHFRVNFFADPAAASSSSSLSQQDAICEFHRLSGDRALFHVFVRACSAHLRGEAPATSSVDAAVPTTVIRAPVLLRSLGSSSSSSSTTTTTARKIAYASALVTNTHGVDAAVLAEMLQNSASPEKFARGIVCHPSGIVRKLCTQLKQCGGAVVERRGKVAATLKSLVHLAGAGAIPDLSPFLCLVDMLSPDHGHIRSYKDHAFRRTCLQILAETVTHIPQDLVRHGAIDVLRAQDFASYDSLGASLAGQVLRKMTNEMMVR